MTRCADAGGGNSDSGLGGSYSGGGGENPTGGDLEGQASMPVSEGQARVAADSDDGKRRN
jgi:hypothetical protein